MKLFCDRSSADNLSPFEDQRLVASLGKIEGRDKPIVPAADYEDALSSGHVPFQLVAPNFREPVAFQLATPHGEPRSESGDDFKQHSRLPGAKSWNGTWSVLRMDLPGSRRLSPVAQNHLARNPPGGAHNPAARMGRRAAHIEVLDGRPVVRPAGHRPQKKQLFERQLALKDVSLRQPEFALEVEWRQHLPPDNNLFQIGREFRDRVDHVVAEPLALLVPRAVAFRQF